MFTGIISGVGRISQVKPAGNSADDGVHVTIEANNFDLSGIGLGDSIAVQGACMTVVSLDEGGFQIDVSRESLDKTAGLDKAGEVNLERSLKLGDSWTATWSLATWMAWGRSRALNKWASRTSYAFRCRQHWQNTWLTKARSQSMA